MTRRPTSPRPVACVVETRASNCSSIELATRIKWLPACVARTPPDDRSKIVMPIEYSNWLTQRLSVDCFISKDSAARRKLPWSAAATAQRKYCRPTADAFRWGDDFFCLEPCFNLTTFLYGLGHGPLDGVCCKLVRGNDCVVPNRKKAQAVSCCSHKGCP